MKRSYVETFFRHRFLLVAPVLIALLLAASYGLTRPRNYIASATIWTDRRIPADSAIGTNPGGADVPSAGQMALLTSLLTSRTFMYAVAKDSPRAGELRGSRLDVDLALGRLASTVSVATPGPQVVAIAVKQPSPQEAVGVAAAVVRQFIREEERRIKSRAKAQVTYDQRQLEVAAASLQQAREALLEYNQAHPGTAQNRTDPTEAQLASALAQAEQQNSEAAKAYSASLGVYKVGTAEALEVLDKPDQAVPQSRKKVVLFSGIGGLLAGLSISVLALLLLVARDGAVREEADLQKALGLRVVGSIGEFSKRRRLAFAGRQADEAAAILKGPS